MILYLLRMQSEPFLSNGLPISDTDFGVFKVIRPYSILIRILAKFMGNFC